MGLAKGKGERQDRRGLRGDVRGENGKQGRALESGRHQEGENSNVGG